MSGKSMTDVFKAARTRAARVFKRLSGAEELKVLAQQQLLLINDLRHDVLMRSDPRYQDARRLNRYELQIFSQFGEDGMIAEIFRRVEEKSRYFVEFGAGEGIENNTAALLLQGWRGFWIEGGTRASDAIRKGFAKPIAQGRLAFASSFVTPDNIETLLQDAGVPKEFDLLSMDIDGNDYWVWKAITRYTPRVVVAEYNATFGDRIEWVMKYNPNHAFDSTNYFGCSLKSYELLFAQKGYRLVGCGASGVNAFFVRDDLVSDELFLGPFTAETHFEPARDYVRRKLGEPRTYKVFDN